MPDKAIDVIDEAGARVRIKTMTYPPDLNDLTRQEEELKKQKDLAVQRQEFEQAGQIRDQLEKIATKKKELQAEWREQQKKASGIVDETVVREVVSKITGVPLTRISTEDSKRLLQMEDELHKRVISQHEAIQAVSERFAEAEAVSRPQTPHRIFRLREI